MLETCRTDVDTHHAGFGMADRILRRLPRSAPGDEYIQISAVFLFGPQQVMFGTMNILVPPHFAGTVQVFDGRRKWVTGVEVADGIGVRLRCAFSRFSFHECSLVLRFAGVRIIHADQSTASPNRASSSRRPAFVTRMALLSRSFVTHFLFTAASNKAEPRAPPR